ncbi:MAG: hypothetical protein JO268_11025 [Pseudonocardiales bacterium]|nr:hypothetical protein [Pseudonocardiales bacterium]
MTRNRWDLLCGYVVCRGIRFVCRDYGGRRDELTWRRDRVRSLVRVRLR